MLSHSLRYPSLLVLVSLGWAAAADAKPKPAKESAAEEVKLDDEEAAKEEASETTEPAESEEPAAAEAEEKKEDGEEAETTAGDAAGADTAIAEAPGKTYYFVGARVRAVVIPSFIIEAFGEGGQTVVGPMFGPEFAIRRDGFEYNFALSYTAYPMDRTPFKSPTDPHQAMELVESRIKVLYATADFMWSHHFSPAVALTYGGGVGLGFVWGPLYRAQAYPVGGGWELCPGESTAANPGPSPAYCAADPTLSEQHYGDYEEKNWADGGSKPLVMPWLAIQTGLRFKLHRNFVGRAEVGIGLGQVFVGLGADYGL
jgi:hypothetical protein